MSLLFGVLVVETENLIYYLNQVINGLNQTVTVMAKCGGNYRLLLLNFTYFKKPNRKYCENSFLMMYIIYL